IEVLTDPSLPKGGPGHSPGNGNFVVTRVRASIVPRESSPPAGRYVRIDLPGERRILSLAEVEVYQGGENVARRGKASQSSTDFEGPAALAIDGTTNGDYNARSTTHTATEKDPWWELDLGEPLPIDRIAIFNRTDNALQKRLAGARVSILDAERKTVWSAAVEKAPERSVTLSVSGARTIAFAAAFADFEQRDFPARAVLDETPSDRSGWAIAPEQGKPHALTLAAAEPVRAPEGSTLVVVIEQDSRFDQHTIGKLRVSATSDGATEDLRDVPAQVIAIARKNGDARTAEERSELTRAFLAVTPALDEVREAWKGAKDELAQREP